MTCIHCGQPITPGPVASLPWVHTKDGEPTRQRCYPRHSGVPYALATPAEAPC